MINRTVLLLAVAIIGLGGAMPRPAWAAVAGEVLVFSGQPVLTSSGQHSALKIGDPVNVGDTIDVPDGAKLRLRMADGSVLSLAAGSHLTIQSYEAGTEGQHRDVQLSLSSGVMRTVVASAAQPSRFEVDTATGVAAVRSTDWFIEARPGGTQVAVLDGTVDVTSRATKKDVAVGPRWGTRVDAGRDVMPPRVYSQAEFDQLLAQTSFESGWCQCIDAQDTIRGVCQASVNGCRAYCAPGHYSFLPAAPETCANGPSAPSQ